MFYVGEASGLLEEIVTTLVPVRRWASQWRADRELAVYEPDDIAAGPKRKSVRHIAYVWWCCDLRLTRCLQRPRGLHSCRGIFGTIMAANVWMRILPAQSKDDRPIKPPATDAALAAQAKLRSKQTLSWQCPWSHHDISNHFAP